MSLHPSSDVRYTTATEGTRISFDVRVSSQRLGDRLTFTMGGTFVENWSGEVPWERVSYEIPGNRPIILQWEYRKDTFTVEGSDTAWIRRIVIE